MISKSIRLTAALSAAALVSVALTALPGNSVNLSGALEQAVCSQKWQEAIKIVNKAIAAAPKTSAERTELAQYRKQLQGLLKSGANVPNWSESCQATQPPTNTGTDPVSQAPATPPSSGSTVTTPPSSEATNPPATTEPAAPAPSTLATALTTPGFSVKGSKIYGPDGKEFVIKGVSVNGPNWVWPREVTQDANSICNCWKFNLVRVNSLILPGTGTRWTDNNDLDKIVNAFTSRKTVVLIEAHDRTGSYFEGTDLTTLVNWYKQLAQRYKNNPYVWFDIMNEPGGIPHDRTKWVSMHQRVIKAIRDEVGASNIIMAEGGTWGQDSGMSTDSTPVPTTNSAILQDGTKLINFNGKTYQNIIFSFHAYEGWNYGDAKMANYIDRVMAQNLTITIGEYGVKNNYDTKPATQSVFNVAPSRKVGRIAWHWFGGDENDLTTTGNGGGWNINNCTTPTNLSWLGQKVWNDNRQP